MTYDERGLIPAIVQDARSRDVIMLGYMSESTLRRTLEIGQAVFWSRSRQEVWHKGATSGDYVNVLGVTTDCDGDVVLLQAELVGGGICHTGARSCFVEEDGVTARRVALAGA
ncbi:MAG: phosphoribosyl-AMP cyclohydrolase [Chloroflexi bacterium]|nr:phosphoribosyl-AMP cyclohydrolase [Chloroflexota bacterium]